MLNRSTSVTRFNAFLQLNILDTSKRLHFLSLSLLFCSISVYIYYAHNISSRIAVVVVVIVVTEWFYINAFYSLFIFLLYFVLQATMKSCFVFLQNTSRVCVMRVKFKVNLRLTSALDFYKFF